jgi:hypothetical protein
MYQFWKGELTVGDLKSQDITSLSCALFPHFPSMTIGKPSKNNPILDVFSSSFTKRLHLIQI